MFYQSMTIHGTLVPAVGGTFERKRHISGYSSLIKHFCVINLQNQIYPNKFPDQFLVLVSHRTIYQLAWPGPNLPAHRKFSTGAKATPVSERASVILGNHTNVKCEDIMFRTPK